MALLEEVRSEYAEHDSFLHLLLGLVSLSQRLERWVPATPEPSPASRAADSQDERAVLGLLGLLSLRRTFLQGLEPPPAPQGPAPDARSNPARQDTPLPRELLR